MRELNSYELLQLLGDVFPDIPASIIKARYQYFQRNQFPPFPGPRGSGWRVGYDLTMIWQLLVAFELLRNWVGPGPAMHLVQSNWPKISNGVARAWRRAMDDENAPDATSWPRYLVFRGNAFDKPADASPTTSGDVAHEDAISDFALENIRSGLALDLAKLASPLFAALTERDGETAGEVDRIMRSWAQPD